MEGGSARCSDPLRNGEEDHAVGAVLELADLEGVAQTAVELQLVRGHCTGAHLLGRIVLIS